MEKPVAISLGGLESKIPRKIREKIDLVHIEGTEVPSASKCPHPDMIIVIGKFSGGRGIQIARAIAESRGNPPIIMPMTWNYVIQEIHASPQLQKWSDLFDAQIDEEEKKLDEELAELQPTPPAPVVPAAPTVSTKLLWEAYERLLGDAIAAVFKPGEKMDVAEFLPIVAEEVGLSEEQVKRLLPYLAISGVIDNPVGDTWRLLGSDGFTVDLEPAPKPKEEPETHTLKVVTLIKGLYEGPYRSRYAIESAMMTFQEFVNRDGSALRRPQAYKYVKKALEMGIVFERDAEFYVTHDDKVSLTPIPQEQKPEPPPKLKVEAETEKPAPEAEKPKEEPLRISDDVKFLRSVIGKISRPQTEWKIVMGIKSILPGLHWDKLADNTVMKMLRKKSVSPRPIPKPMFTPEEWDTLAWETAKDFTVGTIAPFFTVTYYDEELFCFACQNMFMFSVAEKKFYFERELSMPKRCPECRKKKGP